MHCRCQERDRDTNQRPGVSMPGRFGLESLPVIKRFLDGVTVDSCEFNLATLFCWGPIYAYQWGVYNGRLLVYDGKNNHLLMPVGKEIPPEALFTLVHELADTGRVPKVAIVSKSYIDNNPDIRHFFTVEADRNAAEYIYETRSLLVLKGEKLHKKRNLISQFRRRHPDHAVVPLDEGLRPKVRQFALDLLHTMDQIPETLAEEFSAMERAFAYWDLLRLEGLVLTVGGKIAAFSVFSPLTAEIYNIHFEKSNMAFKGAAQVINQETARVLEGRCRYLNREQDLGIPGLRQAKLSYEPHRLAVPHILRLKNNA